MLGNAPFNVSKILYKIFFNSNTGIKLREEYFCRVTLMMIRDTELNFQSMQHKCLIPIFKSIFEAEESLTWSMLYKLLATPTMPSSYSGVRVA